MNPSTVHRFVIYSRKSKFTGKGESVENQVEMCRRYISVHFGEEAAAAAKVFEDEGFSGGNLNRPQFQKMMRDLQRQRADALVVYRLDRISRNIGDFANLIRELSDQGIEFISIREQFDTASPMGRAMMYIASVFSQLERETIAERIRDNMNELAKSGRWLGGNTPLGYTSESVVSVTVDGKSKKAYKLKTVPAEKEVILHIFDQFLENGSLTMVEHFLSANQFVTRSGKPFSRVAIRAILSNPVYMVADEDAYDYLNTNGIFPFCTKEAFDGTSGVMVYNRTLQRPGQTHQTKPTSEWIAAVGKHEGMIRGERWIQTQKLLERNRSKSYKKPRSGVALLCGMLYCADCGGHMRPKLTNRVNAAGEPIYTYLCTTKERSRSERCSVRNINGNTLDAAVMDILQTMEKNGSELIRHLEHIRKRLIAEDSMDRDSIGDIRHQIAQEKQKVTSLTLTLSQTAGLAAEKYTIELIEESHAKIQQLQERLQQLEHTAISELTELDMYKQMLCESPLHLRPYTVEEKRTVIRALVQKIVWDGQAVKLYLIGSDIPPQHPPADCLEPLRQDSE